MKDKNIFNFLLRLNYITILVTLILLILTVFVNFDQSWAYFPIFPYIIPKQNIITEFTFYAAYLHEVNLGYYVQLIMVVFAFMVYFAKKNLIAFQFAVAIGFLHSVLIIIQAGISDDLTRQIFSGQPYFKIFNWFYSIYFLLLFIANYYYDIKKAPTHPGGAIKEN